jgi:nucleotide-binding universal stress UspA family protein
MLPKIGKILYCTDLSDSAGNAFRYALGLSQATGAEIHLLNVVAELTGEARIAMEFYLEDAGGPNVKKVRENRIAQARTELLRRKDAFKGEFEGSDRGLDERIVSASVVQGHPAESILKKADEIGCDLIVMGTHEKGAIRAFLGSVARTVIGSSKIPVLVVPLP